MRRSASSMINKAKTVEKMNRTRLIRMPRLLIFHHLYDVPGELAYPALFQMVRRYTTTKTPIRRSKSGNKTCPRRDIGLLVSIFSTKLWGLFDPMSTVLAAVNKRSVEVVGGVIAGESADWVGVSWIVASTGSGDNVRVM